MREGSGALRREGARKRDIGSDGVDEGGSCKGGGRSRAAHGKARGAGCGTLLSGLAAFGFLATLVASDGGKRPLSRPAYLACLGSVPQNILPNTSMQQDREGEPRAQCRRGFTKSFSTGSLNMHQPLVSGFLRKRSSSSFFRLSIHGSKGSGLNLATTDAQSMGGGSEGQPDHTEGQTEFIAECKLPTEQGHFRLRSYRYKGGKIVIRNGERVLEWTEMEPVVVIRGDLAGKEGVTIRVHDQCFTSEVLGSKRCDCKEQLDMAMGHIMESEGALIYMPQEGRGIGLANKIAAYELQDTGMDTVDANRHLGFDDDERSYSCVPFILKDMGIKSVRLVTNNPYKINMLRGMGVAIDSVQPSFVVPNMHNEKYLRTKVERMAHLLSLDSLTVPPPADALAFAAAAALSNKPAPIEFATVEAAAEQLRNGNVVLVVSGDGAEARGGLVVRADASSTETVSSMGKLSGAYLEALLPGDRWDALGLGDAAASASVDMVGLGSIAIAAGGRASTLSALADPGVGGDFFSKPGHVFCRKMGAGQGGSVMAAAEVFVREAGGEAGPPVVGMCEVLSDGGVLAPGMAHLAQVAETMGIVAVLI